MGFFPPKAEGHEKNRFNIRILVNFYSFIVLSFVTFLYTLLHWFRKPFLFIFHFFWYGGKMFAHIVIMYTLNPEFSTCLIVFVFYKIPLVI